MSDVLVAKDVDSFAGVAFRGSRILWLITLTSGAAAILLAFWGWTVQLDPLHARSPAVAWESVGLRSVKALAVSDIPELADMKPGAHLPLGLAQVFGAVFYLLLAGRVLFFTLGARFTEAALRNRRGHDLVIGGGPATVEYAMLASRKLTHMSFGFGAVLNRSAKLDRVGSLKQQLQRGGAARARRVVVDEGEDAATWQTAQSAAKLNHNIDVIAHIRDPWIHERLSRASPEARLRTFSYASGIARQIMLAHPPYLLARRYQAPAQHILIFGFGSVGQSLVREFLVTSVSSHPAPMMITVVDPDIERLEREFVARMPGLRAYVDLDFVAGELVEGDATLERLRARHGAAEVCAIYVAIDVESRPLSLGYTLRDRAEALGIRAPIFICAQHGAGLSQARQGAGAVGVKDWSIDKPPLGEEATLHDRRLGSFGSWIDALDGSGLFEEPELDGYAKSFHTAYLAINPPAPGAPRSPSQEPWGRLDDEYRIASRRAAAHIRSKLDAAGFDLDAWLGGAVRRSHDLPASPDVFNLDDPALLEALADLEHQRWVIDRALNGWRFGPVRDNHARIHPQMKPSSEQSEEEREKDRSNVRQTVEILRRLVGKRRTFAGRGQ